MHFLRERDGKQERVYMDENYSAKEKADALYILRGQVILVKHPFDLDPSSGAGTCWCGRGQRSMLHEIEVEETDMPDMAHVLHKSEDNRTFWVNCGDTRLALISLNDPWLTEPESGVLQGFFTNVLKAHIVQCHPEMHIDEE